jgi:hypothetical protein
MSETISPEVRRLLDRQAILDCVYRYCRGLDRHDFDLLASCFHQDAIDQHGDFMGPLPEFLEFAKAVTIDSFSHAHYITCHFAEIDGDLAHAESYVIGVVLEHDKTLMALGGRYIDRFERRDGEWRIALRRVVRDWRFDADAHHFTVRENGQTDERGFPLGRRDRSDISYQRPLQAPSR